MLEWDDLKRFHDWIRRNHVHLDEFPYIKGECNEENGFQMDGAFTKEMVEAFNDDDGQRYHVLYGELKDLIKKYLNRNSKIDFIDVRASRNRPLKIVVNKYWEFSIYN